MDPLVRFLFMMRRLAQRPVSRRHFYFVMGILAFCLIVGLTEYVFGWPEWLTANPRRLHRQPIIQ